MNDRHHRSHQSARPDIYRIVLEGQLGDEWSNWFESFSLSWDQDGQTVLVGPVADQAALHAVLRKILDLGIPLVSINRLPPGENPLSSGSG